MLKKFFLITIAFFMITSPLYPCTTGLADKKFATNKRALLWKNRDSSHKMNELILFDYGNVKFIGLINNNDTTQVWSGVNNFGFAIMNSESRDLISLDDTTCYDDEGVLMKEALKTCKTIDDFENLLNVTNESGRKVTSNFGVIDANGRAAYFETGNHQFFKQEAQKEFIIRANFSMNGRGDEKYGLFRYHRAHQWFQQLTKEKNLTPAGIINNIIADPYMPPTITPKNFKEYKRVYIYDSICRYSTVAATVVEGVQRGENPEMTTFWINLGSTAASVAIPLWVYAESIPESMAGEEESELNRVFRELRDYIGNGDKKHISPANYREIRKALAPLQKEINKKTQRQLKKWRRKLPPKSEVADFQNEITTETLQKAKELLNKIQQKK